jgi:proline utilization trans-activator
MRLSTTLGLHRNLSDGAILSSAEREHRTRLWWTVYVFDRSTSSRLGQPITIQDSDIDVSMPGFDLSKEVQQHMGPAAQLIAYVELSRITGSIMQDIYGPSSKANPGRFVQHVRAILKKLKKWDAHAPPNLRLGQGPIDRSVASLQLHFNQCIILTTRPILLHVLKVKKPFSSTPEAVAAPISDTAKTLADACVSAARTSNSIISQLFVENALATYGYFDTHHLFSSTLVLIISAIVSPSSSDSDAVQTAFQLLKGMRDSGNATATQYFSRLVHMQWNVSRLFARANAADDAALANNAAPSSNTPMNYISPDPLHSGFSDFENYDWGNFFPPTAADLTGDGNGGGNTSGDPLDNPVLQAFLDTTDASWDENLGLTSEEIGGYVI